MAYPKWKYHAEKEPALVKDEAAECALGRGWCESPAEACAIPAEEEKEDLKPIAQAPEVQAPMKRTKRGKSA